MSLENNTNDRVLICIIDQDNGVSAPNVMGDLGEVVQELDHEVLFFSSQKKNPRNLKFSFKLLLSHNPRARARIRFLVAFFARGVPGIFASFLFYLVKNTRAAVAVAAAGKKSVVFEEFAYFYATIKL